MTDNEIIEALEHCHKISFKNYPCENCPLINEECFGGKVLMKRAVDLINRQKTEIEELNELYINLKNANVQHCLDNEKDRQLLGEYQNIFLDLGYATEVFDPNLTEIKGWVTRMLWHCKRCDELLGEINHLKLRLKNVNEHELHLYKALKTAKAEAVKEFAERLKENFNNLEYNARTTRKTVKTDELREQMDWVLHMVAPKTIDNLVKENVFVAVDDDYADEIYISLDCFDEDGEG